jgi:tetratricopeptide (TPR) repeat protein
VTVARPPLGLALRLALVCALAACQAPAGGAPTDPPASCAALDAAWGQDWPATLRILERLIAADQACGAEPLASKQYAAHYSYAVALESTGQVADAIAQYQLAFALDPQRREAWDALARLNSLPPPTPPACLAEAERLTAPYASPTTGPSSTVAVQRGRLALDGGEFRVRGVNYYPRHTPWQRFLTQTDSAEMAAELDLISQAGFNTLRIFLWYDPLFTCRPEDAVPVASTFAVVDRTLQLAHERGLKVIVTLNDLPDLTYRPLYTDWARTDAQTRFIVQRYRDEPAILAWDLRNEGDLDYGARSPFEGRFTQEQVLGWLAHAGALVHENAPRQLVTAGWWGDPLATDAAVDVLAFHHWTDAGQLQARIADYRARTSRPVLLEEFGYHSWQDAPGDARDEATQARLLQAAAGAAEDGGLAGWLVWTAFDFAPPPGQAPTAEHFFGIWRIDLSAKLALPALQALQPTITPDSPRASRGGNLAIPAVRAIAWNH